MYKACKGLRKQYLIPTMAIVVSFSGSLASVCADAPNGDTAPSGVPIKITVPRESYATVVIEDQSGRRVRNLLASQLFPKGTSTVYWDGYDDGVPDADGNLTRHKAAPGIYTVRGLTRDGLHLRYEFSVNSPGNPPWPTKDGSGAWLGDHTPSGDILYLPDAVTAPNGKPGAHFIVCCSAAESGEEFVWLGADGNRLYGANTGFWGATHLARDRGTSSDPDYYAYAFESGERDVDNNNLEVRGFKQDGSIETAFLYKFPMALKKTVLTPYTSDPPNDAYSNDGLAVYNGRIVISFTRMNELIVADARTHQQISTISIDTPRGLTFDNQGRLYVVTGQQVKRYTLSADGTQLSNEKTLVSNGLVNPTRISLDSSGTIYISDVGKVSQVKVFTPNGALVRSIGKLGGPQVGLYDELRMSNPQGTAVDGDGNLWVAEEETLPKRISEWKGDGVFIRAFYGPPKYGGGGAIDPRNKNRFFYAENNGGVEFSLDWTTGTSKPYSIYWRPGVPGQEAMPGSAPERAFYAGGYEYLVNCYNGELRDNGDRGTGVWRLDKDGIARPVAVFGTPGDLNNGTWGWDMINRDAIDAQWPSKDTTQILFAWCDKNNDHIAEQDEFQSIPVPLSTAPGHPNADYGVMPLVQPDLSVTLPYGAILAAPKIDASGVPIYDLTKISRIGDTQAYRSVVVAGNDAVSLDDANPELGSLVGARLNGSHTWGMNALREEQQPQEGQMLSVNRFLGPAVTPPSGDAVPLVAINGEMGSIFLVTTDGLFVQDLGGDSRTTPFWRYPVAKRGMQIDPVSFEQEHFHPTIDQTADGKIYLVAGFQHSSILDIDGLDSVRRVKFGAVALSQQFLAALPETLFEQADRTGRKDLTVYQAASPPALDGNPSSWAQDAQWVILDNRATASIVASGGVLYAAYRTGDPDALDNAGGDIHSLFKKGGALDLMIGSNHADQSRRSPVDGDERLLVTQVNGKTKAVLYCEVIGNAPDSMAYEYESPIGRVDFDKVTDVSDQVTLKSDGKGGYEFSVPYSVLGLNVAPGSQIFGDVGLLRGSGGKTSQRLYWNNRHAITVSDLPSEARLEPAEWGVWHF